MKKNTFWGLIVGIFCSALSLLSFTSCDDDVNTSVVLSGDWEGDFGMYYDYYDRHDRFVGTFDCYDTDISFYPDYDYSSHGYGYQVDYYDRGPYSKIYHSFDWEIHNDRVYLYYNGESELNTVIYDYRLSNANFSGYFDDSNSRFSLRKYRDYYNWDPYWRDYGNHGYGYYYNDGWYYDDYYYSRAAEGEGSQDETAQPVDGEAPQGKAAHPAEGGTIRYGNRFKK